MPRERESHRKQRKCWCGVRAFEMMSSEGAGGRYGGPCWRQRCWFLYDEVIAMFVECKNRRSLLLPRLSDVRETIAIHLAFTAFRSM